MQVLQQLQPVPQRLAAAAAAAAAGDILPLTMITLDVVMAPADGSKRCTNAIKDPVVAITCVATRTSSSSTADAAADPGGAADGAAAGGDSPCAGASKVAFLLAGDAARALPSKLQAEGMCLQLYRTEAELLEGWRQWFLQQDPDVVCLYQVRLCGLLCRLPLMHLLHRMHVSARTCMVRGLWSRSNRRLLSASLHARARARRRLPALSCVTCWACWRRGSACCG